MEKITKIIYLPNMRMVLTPIIKASKTTPSVKPDPCPSLDMCDGRMNE